MALNLQEELAQYLKDLASAAVEDPQLRPRLNFSFGRGSAREREEMNDPLDRFHREYFHYDRSAAGVPSSSAAATTASGASGATNEHVSTSTPSTNALAPRFHPSIDDYIASPSRYAAAQRELERDDQAMEREIDREAERESDRRNIAAALRRGFPVSSGTSYSFEYPHASDTLENSRTGSTLLSNGTRVHHHIRLVDD